jgi:hypothetical protein
VRVLEFVVYSLTIEDVVQTSDGNGELPVGLMTEPTWDVNERMGSIGLLRKRGDLELPIHGVQMWASSSTRLLGRRLPKLEERGEAYSEVD